MSLPQRPDEATRRLVDPACRVTLAGAANPVDDAAAERLKATFDSEELAAFLHDGVDKLQRREELVKLLQSQPWSDKTHRYFLTREQEYVGGLEAAVGIWQQMRGERLSMEDGITMRSLAYFPGGLELHIGMFIPTILGQGTPEQQAKWLPLCNRLQIIGTYAQTELGHGTFVRGLQTVAVYDEASKEFVVHSPSLESTKWWPGGMGKTATHVILMARLFVKGKDYGPHSFVVQIRDLATHLPLAGVSVGDIGPKMGFNGVDNGYLSLDHVRIPRDAMLMRFAQVTEEGRYIPPPPDNQKAAYATMVYVRATIVRDSGDFLSRAVTIATRYAAVRRQTATKLGEPELQVLDYDNVQQILLPLMSRAYALVFMGRSMMDMYHSFDSARARGDFSVLPELHALSSGLKALSTDIAATGIETARRQCGGHGYMLASGLPTLFNSYVQNCTWEGDNNVMYLQTARYLMKAAIAVQTGKPLTGSAKYLSDAARQPNAKCQVAAPEDWRAPAHQLAALAAVAAQLTAQAAAVLARAGGGRPGVEGEAWNSSSVDLIRAARAHIALYLHQNFIECVEAASSQRKLSAGPAAVLRQLVALHGVATLLDAAGDLQERGYATGRQVALLRGEQRTLVRALRPNAVALTDSFGYPDYMLNSALGRRDGNVYQALLDSAKSSPLNATQEGPAWKPVLEPLLNPQARSRL
ncbi:peroxisomal acyl-coenzyme A oxidase 1-like [Micractinium conductrix]|uniref:Acyl-coenzyme A oxidase n=1 Tax=Micractinium conductrix TaxID=554055 RepID=A0A2P6V6E8_9CHLO|nr:peroxisomal acyl-coenzyme A oxidase 1-like [Micractinium conductrix]|eukprot:PSC69663.1 peroxisomal acyl-coenzyme A oxidase 1-like [Micractinium conductrix]